MFASRGPGGPVARRLLPAVVCLLMVLGVLRWEGEQLGLYGTGTGVLLLSVAAIAFTSGLLLVFGRWLDEHHAARRSAEVDAARTARYFELARDLVCTADYGGCFQDLNSAWTKTLGWSERELCSRRFVDFVHPEDRERTERETARLAAGEVSVDFVNRYATRDGGWRWLEWSAHVVPEEGLIYAAARDISERKLAERSLMAQHEATRVIAAAGGLDEALPALLRTLCEQLDMSVGVLWARDGGGPRGELRRAALWHDPGLAVEHLRGATERRAAAEGEDLDRIVLAGGEPHWTPDVALEPRHPRREAATGDGLHASVLLPIRGGGDALALIELLSDEVRDAEPALIDTLATLSRQIGQFLERKRGEAAVEASERQTRQILDTAYEAFISIDERGAISYWNRQAEATLGWSSEEVVGLELAATIIPERYRQAHRDGIRRFLATGEGPALGRSLELSALHRDGHELPIELTISALETVDGHRFHAFLRDITERKRSQDAMALARDQAIRLARQKSEFLANMSHEIRTPMNGVIGMIGLLLDTELDREQREYAETVRASGETLLAIINDILDFSKIEAGKLELEAVDFDLRATLEEAVGLLAEQAHRKRLELATFFSAELPVAVRGDPNRLRQVLTNLVGNAIKFTEAGEVVVRAELAEQSGHALVARLEVCDTGVGIAPEAKAHLFDAFVQADASTTRNHGGTGLGLAICKQLVELMGGRIGVTSEPGHGSTFTFTVALGKQPAARLAPTGEQSALAGRRVLIVDDSDTSRASLERHVGSWGMAATCVAGGAAALAALGRAAERGEPFDVALLDRSMPGMDGLQLAREIGADPALRSTPLVLLTTLDAAGSSRPAEVAEQLSKPVRHAHLHDCLADLVGERAVTAPADPEPPRSYAGRSARLLVAEDNPVNQKVALAMLRKLGYRADVVSNGVAAVKALSSGRYEAVLMDCQMPEMDGYAATAAIRWSEGPERTPVIAMTASVAEGERERCLAAGMDDYISKPVGREELEATLARWVERGEGGPAGPPAHDGGERDATGADTSADGGGEGAETIDRDRLTQLRGLQLDGEPDVLAELAGPFLEAAPGQLVALRSAARSGDAEAVGAVAHALKGSGSNIGAARMAALCAELEARARAGELEAADAAIGRIEAEFARVRTAFEAELRAAGPPPAG